MGHGVAPMASPYGGYFGMEQDEMYGVEPPYGAYPAPPQDVFYGNDLFYAGYPALNVNLNGYETVKRAKNGVATSPSPKKSDSKQVKATTDMSPGRRVNKIQKQLEYYFSSQNMDSDTFLRESMAMDGFVHIDVITAFNRMNVLGATKELVVEAAFHSTNIEVDTQNPDRIRMTKLWKEYVRKNREKRRREERKKQRELDEAEVNTQTIDDIVALITKKDRRRKKRRELRQKQKEKEAKKKKEKAKDAKDDEKEEVVEETKTEKKADK